jgi:hypothetical protein
MKYKFDPSPKITRAQYKDLQKRKYRGVTMVSYEEEGVRKVTFNPFDVFQSNIESMKDDLMRLHYPDLPENFEDELTFSEYEELYKEVEKADILEEKKKETEKKG